MVKLKRFYEEKTHEYNPVIHAKRHYLLKNKIYSTPFSLSEFIQLKGIMRCFAYDDRFKRVTEVLTSLILDSKFPLKILDVGCGDGIYEHLLTKGVYSKAIFDGLDISVNQKRKSGHFFRNFFITDIDTEKIPTRANTYDIVICSELLEHLFHPEKVLIEIKRVLKQKGLLIITIPNVAMLQNRIALLFGYASSIIYPYEQQHIRFFNIKGIKKVLNKAGFADIIIEGLGGFFISKYTFGVTIPTPRMFQLLVNKLIPSLASGLLIVCNPRTR